ncbi:TetR/AcrR family transcriptional regulator [Hyphobacterium marinum]|uniref:TetR/AcrR family transcriptional regulator n=1 Tax=Hyphobacterium marinum TaxID=3116574 RepID=A0ABU7M085_9PROT|nr:TetR/AcrR family transcriptional regulator [Hyphobacterium sp. Y6023]MEE2567213.1 TetR/AcrR family transcriptional regulator [Hyphobacterium sp. Y6023]
MQTYLRADIFDRDDDATGVAARDGTTRARIERAALKLFAQGGIDGVSIKDIAGACGLSDGAMYRHFESKEALARTLFEAIHARLLGLLKASITPNASLKETVQAVVTAYCELAEDDPAQFAYHLTQRNTFLARSGDGGSDPSALLARRVRLAMESGDIPKGDPELKTAMALGVVMQAGEYRLYGRIVSPLTDHAATFTRAILAVLAQA